MSTRSTLGAELRRVREAAGLTQEELAERAGIRPAYVGQVERSTRSPSIDALMRMCDVLGVKASKLISQVEKGKSG